MKKIAFFINNLWSWGSNKVWVDLSNWLDNLYNTVVIALYWEKTWFFCKNHITLTQWKSWKTTTKIASLFRWYFSLKSYLKSNSIETIFTFSMETTLLAILAKRLNKNMNLKIMMTQHENSTFINKYTALQWKIYKIFLYTIRSLQKNLHKIVCVSENTKETLINFWFSWEKIVIIWNGINPSELVEKSLENINKTTPFILHIGNKSEIKNQLLLIEGFARISDQIPHNVMFLWAISDKTYYENLQKRVSELKLESRVFFLWFDRNPYKYLKNSSVLSSTSFSEACPLNILEALCLWVPVVSTSHEWWKEILNNWEYWIITWFSSEEYADWILQLLSDENLHNKYIEKGKERSLLFSQEIQLQKYISLIESIDA